MSPHKRRSSHDPQERQLVIILTVVASLALAGGYFVATHKTAPKSQRASAQPASVPSPMDAEATQPEPEEALEPPFHAAAPQNVLITKNKTYVLPPAQGSTDERTLAALQRNCYNAARNNAGGDYPAMQRQACNDYARYANRMGVETDVPVVAERVYQPQIHVAEPQSADDNKARCAALYAQKRYLDEQMRKGHSTRRAEQLNEEWRQVTRELWELGCRETG